MPQSINFLYVLFCHWVCDFVFQTHWQASNKSHNNKALFDHVTTYSLGMLALTFPMICWEFLPMLQKAPDYDFKYGRFTSVLLFIAIFVTHFCTDWITSRITARFWKKQSYHNFFVVIGFDQLIHQTTLLVTLLWLGLLV